MADKVLKKTSKQLNHENEELRSSLAHTGEALNAIRHGEVDAIVVSGSEGDQIISLTSEATPYRLLLEEMDEGAIIAGIDGTILYCNKRFAKQISQRAEKIIGSNLRNYIIDREKAIFGKLLKKGLKGKSNGVISFLTDNQGSGLYLKLSIRALPAGMVGDICIVASDVTELKRRQELLENMVDIRTIELRNANERLSNDVLEIKKSKENLLGSEERFHSILNNSPDLIYRFNLQTAAYEYMSPSVEQITGYTEEEITTFGSKPALSTIHPDDLGTVREALIQAEISGKGGAEYRFLTKNGAYRWLSSNITYTRDDNGWLLYRDGSIRDINDHKLAEEAVKRSEKLYRAIGETIDYGVWICEPGGRNIYSSESYLKLVGITQEQCSEFSWGDALHPDDAERTITAWKECVRTGGNWDIEHRFRGVDGKWHHILARGVPVRDESGNITCWAGINLDISKIKEAEDALRESEESLKKTQEIAHLGSWELNVSDNKLWWSDEVYRIFGLEPREFPATYEAFLARVHPDDRASVDAEYSGSLSEGKDTYEIEHRVIRKITGEIRFVHEKCSHIRDKSGKIIKSVGMVQDITTSKKAEIKLREGEAKLLELNTTKDKFFNIVAHDLKNPFTSLLGSSELLHENIDQMSNENIKKLALVLNDSAKSGYAILQNLLDWSRSQTGLLKVNPERINLRNLIDENVLNLELFLTKKEIGLKSEVIEDIFIFVDKNMINTILRNILSNAVKYTHRYGKINIRTNLTPDNVIVSVKDTGIGIQKDKIETLFRIDTKHSMPGTENELGTGLGLKLCKEFVEKMGGEIWVESNENEGSEFKFSVPGKNS